MGLLDIFQPTNGWAANAPGGFGAQPSQFTQWVRANPYALQAAGQGLQGFFGGMAGATNAHDALVGATKGLNGANTPAYLQLQLQKRQQDKEAADAKAQQNATVAWIQKNAPKYYGAVQAGVISPADAYKAALQDAQGGAPDYMSVPKDSFVFDKASGKFIQAPQGPASLPEPQPSMMWSPDGKSQIPVPGGKEAFDREQVLNQQYAATDPVKTYQVVRSGYQKIRESAQLGTGAGDISMIFAYMKMLDPTSVVREGEFATAQNAGGVGNTITNLYNSVLNGQKLTPEMRSQFLEAADKLYSQTTANLAQENQLFSGRAQGWGVDPSHFIVAPQPYSPLNLNNGSPDPLGLR